MKRSTRFIAMLFACFVVYFLLPSCNNGSKFTGKTGQKLNGPILIKRYNTTDGSLVLKDQHHHNARYVTVSRGMTIDWNATASGLEIVEIAADPQYHDNFINFFGTDPHNADNPGQSKHWQAIVGSPSTDSGILFEKYYIKWKLKGADTTSHTFDPLLQLNPQ